jgi:hypothetical protein
MSTCMTEKSATQAMAVERSPLIRVLDRAKLGGARAVSETHPDLRPAGSNGGVAHGSRYRL